MKKWYNKVQVQFCVDYRMFPYSHTLREWAFNAESRLYINGKRYYDTYRWPVQDGNSWFSVAVRVLGLDVGFGIFLTGKK